jgi:NAD(P)-dependent dehydrogenase (short-subunit alcohol dehydrogenase family)
MRVAEKVAIVTGGLSGIGVAVAARLAHDGMIVVAADISTQSMALDRTLGIHPFRVDVTDQNSVATLVQAVMAAYGRLDCLVHCAGIGRVLPFLETPLETFDLVLKTNLYGTFIVGQACARVMAAAGRGAIVNIGSVSGLRGNAGRAAYGASKGAIVTLTEVMAVELAEHGVRVNVVAPGPIETPLTATQHDADARTSWIEAVPMRCYGRPEDVASAAAFLCSDDACYITGAVFAVDGGFSGGGILSRSKRQETAS